MAKSVLVTGGAGFIGSHVADRFLAEGWDVTILDDLSSGREENIPSAARFVRGCITSPEAATLVRDVDGEQCPHGPPVGSLGGAPLRLFRGSGCGLRSFGLDALLLEVLGEVGHAFALA
jgi:NAD(P)-dependent dehydrogenase (short-subunit alcohol dehydrogenase family)